MSQLIQIVSAGQRREKDRCLLEYDIVLSDRPAEPQTVWFEADEHTATGFCPEVADGLLVALLPYAISGGYDIESLVPISRDLLNGLRQHVIPQLALCTAHAYPAKIQCPISQAVFTPKETVTAMSLGVDSFTTFFEYTVDCPPYADRVTELAFFEAGHASYAQDPKSLFEAQLARTEAFCRQYGWNLLAVRSNLDETMNSLFGKMDFEAISVYRNLCFVLSLQKRIKTYYYSASYNVDSFACDLHGDVTRYEKWLLPLLCTESTKSIEANEAMSRVEKTAYISQFAETYPYLTVCFLQECNCGECEKCFRTELTLDKMGLLDRYASSFALPAYQQNKTKYLTDLLSRQGDPLFDEVITLWRGNFKLNNRIIGSLRHYLRTNRYVAKTAQKWIRNPLIRKLKNHLR